MTGSRGGKGGGAEPAADAVERLAQYANVADARADAAAYPIETITPWVEEIDGTQYLRIPDGLGYPITREPLDSVRRGFGAAAFPVA